VLGVAAFATAVLALVPRRRVQIATNVLAAICSAFLAVQLARIHTPPADPVALDSPLCGEWAMLAGGRSSLLSHHYPHTQVRDAVDFVRLVNGRAHDGDATREESWYGFGEPVLAPIDGTVVRTFDLVPDEPVAAVGQTPSEGNHVVLEIGEGRYAVLAHLRQGSVRVSLGEQVRGASPAGKRAGEPGRAGATRPADRRDRGLGRLVGAPPAPAGAERATLR
jgi:hypothetical protein